MKVNLDTVDMVLTQHEVDPNLRAKVLADIEAETKLEKVEREPRIKQQYVIVAISENKDIPETPMFIVQIPESDDPNDILSAIEAASKEFNTTPKGMKKPVTKVGDAFDTVQAKFFKANRISVKTKSPTFTIITDNVMDVGLETQEEFGD